MKSPFKFLDPYELKDRDTFFGREAETKELYKLVTKNRLTFVYGPSGIGKTSLIQCGLASRFGDVDWLPVFVRRGTDINTSLRREIGLVLGEGPDFNGDIPEAIYALFSRFLRPVYLIFDQFEELFILGDANELQERTPFYETVADLIEADLPCRILFSMREDYFGHLVHFEKIVPELYNRKLRVEPMNRENLLRVITGSCHVHGIGFENERTNPNRILENMIAGRSGGHIPFAQVYLHMLYQEAAREQFPDLVEHDDNPPSLPLRFNDKVIEAVGPIGDVLERFLKDQESVIQRRLVALGLNPPEDVVRQVLDVFVSEEGTRSPVPFHLNADGAMVLHGKAAVQLSHFPANLVQACLEKLEQSRILRRTQDDFEIAHDSLAAFIDRQRSAEQRQRIEIRRRIQTGYREHVDSGGTYFFDRGQMARIEPFLEKLTLEPDWSAFLDKSREMILYREQAEIRETREQLRRQRILSTVIATIALLAFVAAWWALHNQREAAAANARALENLLVAEREKAEAQANELRAINAETIAQKKEEEARNSAVALAATLFDLGQTTEQVVDALAAEAARHVYHLQYDLAAEKLKTTAALDRPTRNFRRMVQEIAFFWNETGQTPRAVWLINYTHLADSLKTRGQINAWLQKTDAAWFSILRKRYYPDMAQIKGAVFQMGNTEGEANERPRHSVRVSDFYLARTETTVWQFALYVTAIGQSMEPFTPRWGLDGDNPVVKVSWLNAAAYANWLSRQFGYRQVHYSESPDNNPAKVHIDTTANGFRLPTEAEWEYAAGGGGRFLFAGGDDLAALGWFVDNCDTNGVQRSHPVATRRPNEWGLYDLSGNVWEWCQDWYGNAYYEQGQNTTMNNPTGPPTGAERVCRGGSWRLGKEFSLIRRRDYLYPGDSFEDYGFRLAR